MTSKDKYYWGQLRGALTAGQWSSSFPAKAPNGSALSWSELFRKFNKHCPGYRDVTEVASQNHALALLLASNYKDEDEDDGGKPGEYALDLGDEGTLPEERITEARKGYEILKKLESSNFDVSLHSVGCLIFCLISELTDSELCAGLLCICSWGRRGMFITPQQSPRRLPRPKPHSSAWDIACQHKIPSRTRSEHGIVGVFCHHQFCVRIHCIRSGDQGWTSVGHDGDVQEFMSAG